MSTDCVMTEDEIIQMSKKQYVNEIADNLARRQIAKEMLLIQKDALRNYKRDLKKITKQHKIELEQQKRMYEMQIEKLKSKSYNDTETEDEEHIFLMD